MYGTILLRPHPIDSTTHHAYLGDVGTFQFSVICIG